MWWWRRKELERDLERELLSDLELEAAEREEDGLPPEEARRAAQRAFGNATSIKEEIREMSPWTVFDRLAQDLRYGWRALGRNGGSSRRLQEEFPELRKRYWGQHLWARGYFCATVGAVDEATIKAYIENQKWDDDDQGFKITAPTEP